MNFTYVYCVSRLTELGLISNDVTGVTNRVLGHETYVFSNYDSRWMYFRTVYVILCEFSDYKLISKTDTCMYVENKCEVHNGRWRLTEEYCGNGRRRMCMRG
jgi:hypothetical protein